jgi:predicted lipid-binding transport protein (Tim44 family)
MGIFDRLFGHRTKPRNDSPREAASRPSEFTGGTPPAAPLTDEQAVERYRYLLRTASPPAMEQVHAEAFAQLTPEQRRLVLESLNKDLPGYERADRDDPESLARMATRAELRQPGTLGCSFGGMNAGAMTGMGGFVAGTLLNTIAAVVIGTTIADAIFSDDGYDQGYQDGVEAANADTDQGAK